jgi:DNA-binding IclR family transcriptional regulator
MRYMHDLNKYPKRDLSSIQSFDRGLAILKLLASKERMTATEIAHSIGVHQSSISRLLKSLIQAGFVYKPDYHAFALDYGVLLFAGMAMEHFPEIPHIVKICTEIHIRTNLGVSTAILREDRLVYLARIGPNPDASLTLIDNSNYPIYMSSLGLILAYRQGKRKMMSLLQKSLKRTPPDSPSLTAESIYDMVDQSIQQHGFLYMKHHTGLKFLSATTFQYSRGFAAITLLSAERLLSPKEAKAELLRSVKQLS